MPCVFSFPQVDCMTSRNEATAAGSHASLCRNIASVDMGR